MKENGIKDVSRVGLYGLTYKENVDDVRESPTLQMLERMERNLAYGIKVYDPWVKGPGRQPVSRFRSLPGGCGHGGGHGRASAAS